MRIKRNNTLFAFAILLIGFGLYPIQNTAQDDMPHIEGPEVIIECSSGDNGQCFRCRVCIFSSWKKAVYTGRSNDVCVADPTCYTGF